MTFYHGILFIMKTVIILHGMPDKEEYMRGELQSTKHWIPWLKNELSTRGITAKAPELPQPYAPDYTQWKKAFEQYVVDRETVVVGHSCGAGFLVRWLSENNVRTGKVILVAPWMDPHHAAADLVTDFFDFTINPDLGIRHAVTVFYSADDDTDVLDTVELLEHTLIRCRVIALKDKGHFTLEDMGTVQFPELLEEVLQ